MAHQPLPPLPRGVQLLGLRCLGTGAAVLSLINNSPCRQSVDLGPLWRLEERLDGLGEPLPERRGGPQQPCGGILLRPWELGFWRIAPGSGG